MELDAMKEKRELRKKAYYTYEKADYFKRNCSTRAAKITKE